MKGHINSLKFQKEKSEARTLNMRRVKSVLMQNLKMRQQISEQKLLIKNQKEAELE